MLVEKAIEKSFKKWYSGIEKIRGIKMNDLINNNTKPKNIIVLFDMFKQIIGKWYESVVPKSVKQRKS